MRLYAPDEVQRRCCYSDPYTYSRGLESRRFNGIHHFLVALQEPRRLDESAHLSKKKDLRCKQQRRDGRTRWVREIITAASMLSRVTETRRG